MWTYSSNTKSLKFVGLLLAALSIIGQAKFAVFGDQLDLEIQLESFFPDTTLEHPFDNYLRSGAIHQSPSGNYQHKAISSNYYSTKLSQSSQSLAPIEQFGAASSSSSKSAATLPYLNTSISNKVNTTWLQAQTLNVTSTFFSGLATRVQISIFTDKVIYKPNDVIFIEALLINIFSKTPVKNNGSLWNITFQLYSPQNKSIYASFKLTSSAACAFSYKIPSTVQPGEYVITIFNSSLPITRKVILIQGYKSSLQTLLPVTFLISNQLNSEIYNPGNLVIGQVNVSLSGLTTPFNSALLKGTYSVQFNSQVISSNLTISSSGMSAYSFIIPPTTTVTYAILTLNFTYLNQTFFQTYKEMIDLNVLSEIAIDFFPETGLIACNVSNQIYFQAYDKQKMQETDFYNASLIQTNFYTGEVKYLLTGISSTHKGKGYFSFIPLCNSTDSIRYELTFNQSNQSVSGISYPNITTNSTGNNSSGGNKTNTSSASSSSLPKNTSNSTNTTKANSTSSSSSNATKNTSNSSSTNKTNATNTTSNKTNTSNSSQGNKTNTTNSSSTNKTNISSSNTTKNTTNSTSTNKTNATNTTSNKTNATNKTNSTSPKLLSPNHNSLMTHRQLSAKNQHIFALNTTTTPQKLSIPLPKLNRQLDLTQFSADSTEISFDILNDIKVLSPSDTLYLTFRSNLLMNASSFFIMTISVKEQVLLMKELQFAPNSSSILNLTVASFTSKLSFPLSGIVQVSLYRVSDSLLTYSLYLQNLTAPKPSNVTNVTNATNKTNGSSSSSSKSASSSSSTIKTNSSNGSKTLQTILDRSQYKKLMSTLEREILGKKKPSSSSSAAPSRPLMPNISNWYIFKGEILLFIKPTNKVTLSVSTLNTTYLPGDQVNFTVSGIDGFGNSNSLNGSLSISISAIGNFQQWESSYQSSLASFPSEVYLSHEILNYVSGNGLPLRNANNYVDHMFNLDSQDKSSDYNLNLLLSTQNWRRGAFNLSTISDTVTNATKVGKEAKILIQNLYGNALKFFNQADPKQSFPYQTSSELGQCEANLTLIYQNQLVSALTTDYMQNINLNTQSYIHKSRGSYPAVQSILDQTETQFFVSGDQLKNGSYSNYFQLSDLRTNYLIRVNTIDSNGVVGYLSQLLPIAITEPLILRILSCPSKATKGEIISCQVFIQNNLNNQTLYGGFNFNTSSSIQFLVNSSFSLVSKQNMTIKVSFQTLVFDPSASISIQAKAINQPITSAIGQVQLQIVSRYYQQVQSSSGFIKSINSSLQMSSNLSLLVEQGTASLSAKVHLSSISLLLESFQSFNSFAAVTFESVISSSYLAVMAFQSLLNLPSQKADVQLMQLQLYRQFNKNIQALNQYLRLDNGYDYFPLNSSYVNTWNVSNEGLTAYGLTMLTDLQKAVNQFNSLQSALSSTYFSVDQNLINNLVSYFQKRRNGKGSINIVYNSKSPNGKPAYNTTVAFILWSLQNAGITGYDLEQASLFAIIDKQILAKKVDTYILSLSANIRYSNGQTTQALAYAQLLSTYQLASGLVSNGSTSMTLSSGLNLQVEVTALSCLAWMNNQTFFKNNILAGINWLSSQVQSDRIRAPLANQLAMKAIAAYMDTLKNGEGTGSLVLQIYNSSSSVSQTIAFALPAYNSLKFNLTSASLAGLLKGGKNLNFQIRVVSPAAGANVSSDSKFLAVMDLQTYLTQIPTQTSSLVKFTDAQSFKGLTLGSSQNNGAIFPYLLTIQNLQKTSQLSLTAIVVELPTCLTVNFTFMNSLYNTKSLDSYLYNAQTNTLVIYKRFMLQAQTSNINLNLVQVNTVSGNCYEKPAIFVPYYADDQAYVTLPQ